MSELKLKTKVLKLLRKTYPDAFIWKISDKFYSGIPDIFLLKDGLCFFIELKFGKGKPTQLQAHTLKLLTLAGAKTAVCYDSESVISFIYNNQKPIKEVK